MGLGVTALQMPTRPPPPPQHKAQCPVESRVSTGHLLKACEQLPSSSGSAWTKRHLQGLFTACIVPFRATVGMKAALWLQLSPGETQHQLQMARREQTLLTSLADVLSVC